MTTAIDSNVVAALWGPDSGLSATAQAALDAALGDGALVISAPVFAELLAAPGRSAFLLDSFCAEAGIQVDWELPEAVWRTAGDAFRQYAIRRRKQGDPGPRRILTDFLIGAHAKVNGYRLMTLDERLYSAAYPDLRLISI